jgi:hypothetical protein
MRRIRILHIALLFGLLTIDPDISLAADPITAPTRTQIKLLAPYGLGGLTAGLTVTDRVNGTCFTQSLASASRPDAWRCNAGNAILDPCYQSVLGDRKELACPVAGPWSANVVLLTLTAPLPPETRKELSRDNTAPWAIELANGERCSLFTGATPPVAGMRINYGCPGGSQAIGDIDRSQPVWRVFFQAEKSIALEQMDVKVAWF